jgi:prophage tail gpP-like protein
MDPVTIIIGGTKLTNWTEMSLSRSKEELTGSLSVTIFAGAMPATPMLTNAKAGAEILVYVAGNLAFTGTIDKRAGTGAQKGEPGTSATEGSHGTTMSAQIGPNEYTIKLSARGKTKRLIDASHQHETTNMLQPTTKEVVDKLVEPFKVQVEFLGEQIKLDKMRFRDGARVVDELHRVGLENAYAFYETSSGQLRVTDGVGSTQAGDPLILGRNILTFQAEQSEDQSKSKVKVKGQRSKKEEWGEKALLKTFKEVEDSDVEDFVPLTVQHYGDGDEKTLERRARFEMNKRSADSKKITIETFGVQSPSGRPWDIGTTHYVEVPPEGIFDQFECTGLNYAVNADKTFKTTLTLSPPPSAGSGGAGGGGSSGSAGAAATTFAAGTSAAQTSNPMSQSSGGYGLDSIDMNIGAARRAQFGVPIVAGQFPSPWRPAQLAELPLQSLVEAAAKAVAAAASAEQNEDKEEPRPPPLLLPVWFKGVS